MSNSIWWRDFLCQGNWSVIPFQHEGSTKLLVPKDQAFDRVANNLGEVFSSGAALDTTRNISDFVLEKKAEDGTDTGIGAVWTYRSEEMIMDNIGGGIDREKSKDVHLAKICYKHTLTITERTEKTLLAMSRLDELDDNAETPRNAYLPNQPPVMIELRFSEDGEGSTVNSLVASKRMPWHVQVRRSRVSCCLYCPCTIIPLCAWNVLCCACTGCCAKGAGIAKLEIFNDVFLNSIKGVGQNGPKDEKMVDLIVGALAAKEKADDVKEADEKAEKAEGTDTTDSNPAIEDGETAFCPKCGAKGTAGTFCKVDGTKFGA